MSSLDASEGRAIDPGAVSTTGNDLRGLVWKGLALTVVTLGIYRFWYRTDLRRWYWRNTVVGGNALEYRGTAKELLIGFLFALAVLLPLYLLTAYVGLFVGEAVQGVLRPVFFLVFLFLVQYGAFRSRRYRLTRTVWRGLRFNQTGSPVGYALRSIGWFLATGLTFGLLFPVMRRALERYKIENTSFGTAKGGFDAPMKFLMLRWLFLIIPAVLLVGTGGTYATQGAGRMATFHLPPLAAFLWFLGLFWPVLLWPFYRAAEIRTFMSATSFGPVRLFSRFSTKRLYALHAKIIVLAFLGLCGLLALFVSVAPSIFSRIESNAISVGVLILPAILYLVGFVAFSALKELVFNQGFWRHQMESLLVENIDAVDEIIGNPVSVEMATGEGLADALDFGGI